MASGEMRRPALNADSAAELVGERVKYFGYCWERRWKVSIASRVARTTMGDYQRIVEEMTNRNLGVR